MTAVVRHRVVAVAVAALALAATALGTGPARASGETPIPPSPTAFVTDHAGFLSPEATQQLSWLLESYEHGTGHQVIVYIDRTTGGVPIDDWAVRAFKAWGVGRKQENDGAALFIFSDDHRIRIEVGYGLEDKLPDARAGRIIQNEMAPRIRAGDHDGAVKTGVDQMLAAIGGKPEPRQPTAAKGSLLSVLFPIIFFIVIFLIGRRHPWALLLIGGRSWGGRGGGGWGGGGGGWGGGGGFSGGGGMSGGGGASGGW
ncbi:MAG TPA: TPM domain-containing protein [Polyangia bacterium]|nr:TPM domain-containing protein [Polyangia bacterium]